MQWREEGVVDKTCVSSSLEENASGAPLLTNNSIVQGGLPFRVLVSVNRQRTFLLTTGKLVLCVPGNNYGEMHALFIIPES